MKYNNFKLFYIAPALSIKNNNIYITQKVSQHSSFRKINKSAIYFKFKCIQIKHPNFSCFYKYSSMCPHSHTHTHNQHCCKPDMLILSTMNSHPSRNRKRKKRKCYLWSEEKSWKGWKQAEEQAKERWCPTTASLSHSNLSLIPQGKIHSLW